MNGEDSNLISTKTQHLDPWTPCNIQAAEANDEVQFRKLRLESPILVYDSSRFVTTAIPHELPPYATASLVFESRFECGNLALAFRT